MPEMGVKAKKESAPLGAQKSETKSSLAPKVLWNRWKQAQDKLAVRGTNLFGNMWTFYGFLVLSLAPLAPPLKHLLPVVQYTSGDIIQLIALPLLAVGANVIGRRAEKTTQEMHDMVMAQFRALKEEHDLHLEERTANAQELAQIEAYIDELPDDLRKEAKALFDSMDPLAKTPLPDLPEPIVAPDPPPKGFMGKFNQRIAVFGTKVFGSMGAFWGLWALSMLPVVPGLHFLLKPDSYAIQAVIQLVALPLLAVGNTVVGKRGEQLSRETAQATIANFNEVRVELALARDEASVSRQKTKVIGDVIKGLAKQLKNHAETQKVNSSSLLAESRAMLDNDVPLQRVLSHYRRVSTACALGAGLRDARTTAKLSVEAVARKAGIPASEVTGAEGGSFATARTARRIAQAVGADYTALRAAATEKGNFEGRLARIALG